MVVLTALLLGQADGAPKPKTVAIDAAVLGGMLGLNGAGKVSAEGSVALHFHMGPIVRPGIALVASADGLVGIETAPQLYSLTVGAQFGRESHVNVLVGAGLLRLSNSTGSTGIALMTAMLRGVLLVYRSVGIHLQAGVAFDGSGVAGNFLAGLGWSW